MVQAPNKTFRSANAGAFADDAKGRIDLKQYYSAGLQFRNIEPVPKSGFRRMGGTWRVGRQRPPIEALAITSPTPSAGPHTGTQTIWTGTVAGAVAAVFVESLSVSAGTITFVVEASTAGGWVQIGGTFAGGTDAVSRLAAQPPRTPLTAAALRIRATFSESATVDTGSLSVSAFVEAATAIHPRHVALKADDGTAYSGFVTQGIVDFYTDAGFQGAARLASVTAAMLPDLDFYAEARTIGVFHTGLKSQRVFLVGAGHEWTVDDWPFDPVPTADLGGVYPKTDDEWELFFRWTGTVYVNLVVTVDGEQTIAIPHPDAATDGSPLSSEGWSDTTWGYFVDDIQAALEDLPSLGPTVTVTDLDTGGSGFGTTARRLKISFGGALSGAEFDLSAMIVNTADASVLPYHTKIGQTELEDFWSVARGWPGTADLVQDRLIHARNPARPGAIGLSKVAEYFDFNLAAQGDSAARLDAIRSQTNELVVWAKESKFLLAGTTKAVYFATNRTIEKGTPLNFVIAEPSPAAPNCKPFDLESVIYYVAMPAEKNAEGGQQLISIAYDDVSQGYTAVPESILASHLVQKITRTKRQDKNTDMEAAKGWLLRGDGRLVAAQIIRNQEITGFCEWVAADDGQVGEIGIDGDNRLWLAIARDDDIIIERYDRATYFQETVSATPDMAGGVSGLPFADGTTVWALADGYVLGPFSVSGGAIDLADSYASATVGRWIAPVFESMPEVFVTRAEEVLFRPGRIHTANINVIDTDSLAVGANDAPAEDVPLLDFGDPADQPPPKKTKLVTVTGLPGSVVGPTLVITQTRPGELRVRDFGIGARL